MNAPLDAGQRASLEAALSSVTLDDKYTLERGRAYMSGIQALVRLPMLQQARDQAQELNTAGFVSGYRGSPLGGLDLALWKAKKHLAAHRVVFQPGVNEDLAATAVWGTQQVNLYPSARYDGVFSMWYGKGPGVDRSADVLKHGNSAGSSRHGGVLVLAGDDHACKSSTLAHQSEHIFKACGLPVLFPSNVQEYLDFGLHGWAMSRYSGLWVAMKCVTDVVESSASVDIDPHRTQIVLPTDFIMPDGGLNIRWPDPPLVQEARLLDYKWYAALAYVRANKLDRIEIDSPEARFGIITGGKAYLDVRQALVDLGLDDDTCARIGIRLYKVGCVWPLEAQGAQAFARGLQEILVVEEKRQILEYAIKEELYNWPDGQRPRVFGKFDEKDGAGGEWSVPMGNWLLPAHYELSPALIAKAIATRLEKFDLPSDVRAHIAARIAVIDAKEKALAKPRVAVERKPWFCSGCPHNTSTNVPEGSRAMAGIGCHYMTVWMDRNTSTFSQMGGEGVAWTGQAPFTNDRHVFANLGDGTYFHSGLLAIRAAIASKVNITYKILYNDAVAMTGGQPVDGVLSVPQITHQLAAEGATKIVIVTDEPHKYDGSNELAPGVTIHHRDTLDAVQRELREITGTTILIYDQTCATEKRRRRKKGEFPDPARRVVINEAVCEGCGDCSVQSNCLSVEPLETEFGTKRQINQSSCNKDFSCLKGFCPSFVTVEGGQLRKPKPLDAKASDGLPPIPEPALPAIARPYGVLVTGVGGTGVVTIGALVGMAAHLEQKGVTVLDVTGLAQKGGAVMSHVQIANAPGDIHATRIAMGEADLVIGCDAIVTASDECTSRMQFGHTRVVVNSSKTPTADFIRNPNWTFPGSSTENDVRAAAGDGVELVDANHYAVALLGDAIYTNPFVLGYAWQRGWLPLAHRSLVRAIELNGVQVEKNLAAFEWGRRAAHDPASVKRAAEGGSSASENRATVIALHTKKAVDALIGKRMEHLAAYQNAAYAGRYEALVSQVRAAERALAQGDAAQEPLTEAVARNLHKLMAYKDEYEVARLQTDPAFLARLGAQFEGEWKLHFHLAPPLFAKKDANGHLVKKQYGPWMLSAFKLLAKVKFLRGSALDPFGKTEERRTERALIGEYEALVRELVAGVKADNLPLAIELANLPDGIRGFGHVKEHNLRAVRAKWSDLLAKWRQSGGGGTARHAA
ncbi:indolepyruvate ferredoxin oxidoreductase family protein [Trinickia caryophylli]|uniref:Indolepyruvate ferredoxin oxidoreductase n=1 Tax=Trinickia caryophylli TaxID=28094 RepID=A0A1X7FM38_TRICW|nr:indolepyruvate ferredoxin oxidoreductase family protein [Trinickia caryophylli]PMS13136.1 indolepyruvate ferredoxin oxidoreductase [Trinickia caryophylli]TRX19341.1 indolepyruvate ferredoxin oxidoreductase family protein [Trinickia caryophylli]WQE13356.1 indolepyruvate ferredoxin oxidoreductase family protein [Trinickia caryophylli]SMF54010.1 indolepyruvate ferredoxin oxidoreductase [Trinickia caryophylli]GLU34129.1 indolepyruvate ferredoxin oxidoreductase [Trinickia caryophylli]